MKIKNIVVAITIVVIGLISFVFWLRPHTIVTKVPLVLNEKPTLLFEISGDTKKPLKDPMGVTVGQDQKIYISDTSNHQVKIYNKNGNFLDAFGKKGTNNGEFEYPYGIVTLKNNNILVADSGNSTVQEFDQSGAYIKTWINQNEKIKPGAMTIDAKGNVYISDMLNHQIVIVNPQGTVEKKINSVPENLQYPQGIAVDKENLLWVADAGHTLIKELDHNGVIKNIIGGETSKDSFGMVRGVAIDNLNRIFISDTLNNTVAVFNHNQNELFHLSGDFLYPMGIYISNDGKIFIINRGSNTVQVWGYIKDN